MTESKLSKSKLYLIKACKSRITFVLETTPKLEPERKADLILVVDALSRFC